MRKIFLILIIALAFFACDDKGDDDDTPQPHESTITAFGKTITVTGDASIATADFTTAKGKLQTAMTGLDEGLNNQIVRDKFAVMLDRNGFKIIIETGNAGPNADANKSMTIGIDYLLANDAEPTIALAIRNKVNTDDAFAE